MKKKQTHLDQRAIQLTQVRKYSFISRDFFFYNKKGLNPKWKSPRAECGCTDNRIIFCSKESQTLALINRPVLIKRRKLQAQNYDLTRKGVKV